MHSLIKKLFEKKGIAGVSELSPDDRVEYERWRKILAAKETTIPILREFLNSQIQTIEDMLGNLENSYRKNERLFIQHKVYKAIQKAIDAPIHEKERLENYLQDLIKMG